MRTKKHKKVDPYVLALRQIALMGTGIKEEARDYANIGKVAIRIAREVLAGKCDKCGAKKEFK